MQPPKPNTHGVLSLLLTRRKKNSTFHYIATDVYRARRRRIVENCDYRRDFPLFVSLFAAPPVPRIDNIVPRSRSAERISVFRRGCCCIFPRFHSRVSDGVAVIRVLEPELCTLYSPNRLLHDPPVLDRTARPCTWTLRRYALVRE